MGTLNPTQSPTHRFNEPLPSHSFSSDFLFTVIFNFGTASVNIRNIDIHNWNSNSNVRNSRTERASCPVVSKFRVRETDAGDQLVCFSQVMDTGPSFTACNYQPIIWRFFSVFLMMPTFSSSQPIASTWLFLNMCLQDRFCLIMITFKDIIKLAQFVFVRVRILTNRRFQYCTTKIENSYWARGDLEWTLLLLLLLYYI